MLSRRGFRIAMLSAFGGLILACILFDICSFLVFIVALGLLALSRCELCDDVPPGVCVHCSYDTRGNASDICPECGEVASPEREVSTAAFECTYTGIYIAGLFFACVALANMTRTIFLRFAPPKWPSTYYFTNGNDFYYNTAVVIVPVFTFGVLCAWILYDLLGRLRRYPTRGWAGFVILVLLAAAGLAICHVFCRAIAFFD